MKHSGLKHSDVEDRGLIDLYYRGALPADEEADFEDHFLGCPECQAELVAARSFRLGMRAMATEDAARAAAGLGALAWLVRRRWVAAGLAVVLVAVLLPFVIGRGPSPAGGLAAPLANTPVFLLTTVRGGEPPRLVDLGRADQALVLAVDAGDDPTVETYELTITGAGGERVFHQEDLRPNALEAVMVTFPAGFFSAGEYRLTAVGRRGDGSTVDFGGHSFRVSE